MIHISAYKNIIYEEVAGGSPADVTQSLLPPSNALFTLCSLWHSHSCPHRGCWATSYCNQVSGSNEDRERRSAAFPLNSPPAVPQRHTLLASVLHLCGQGWRPVAKLGHGGRNLGEEGKEKDISRLLSSTSLAIVCLDMHFPLFSMCRNIHPKGNTLQAPPSHDWSQSPRTRWSACCFIAPLEPRRKHQHVPQEPAVAPLGMQRVFLPQPSNPRKSSTVKQFSFSIR